MSLRERIMGRGAERRWSQCRQTCAEPMPRAELLHPSYWLVSGLEWQGDGGLAEAAMAVAPGDDPARRAQPRCSPGPRVR